MQEKVGEIAATPTPSTTARTIEPGSGPGAAVAQQQELDRQELNAAVIRLRRATALGAVLWPLFSVLDWIVVTWIHPGRLWWFLLCRALVEPIILVTYYRMRRGPPPSARAIAWWSVAPFVPAAVAVTLMCLEYGGLYSAYGTGVAIVLVLRGAFFGEHFRQGLVLNGVIVAAYPVTLGVAAIFSPSIREQFGQAAGIASFIQYLFFILTAAAFIVLGGHTVWSLRRQVFESRSIGRYRLKRLLGKGGMGEVWNAYHSALRRDVALKILRTDGADRDAVRRFEREVQATTELTHPNTVRVFDYGVTEDGLWYYAMELLEGRDLHRMVEADGRLPPARAVHLAIQAARALAEAHSRGIVHRDVKPENLFVTRAGREEDFVKVLDFGIARVEQPGADQTQTAVGVVVGTPSYMSPEAAAGIRVDASSDVYSLGAVLYFMLTGEPPFRSKSTAQLLYAHVHEAPEPPSRHGVDVPGDVEAIVLRCLEKLPGDRYEDAAALAEALSASELAGTWKPADAATSSTVRPIFDSLAPTVESNVAPASGEQTKPAVPRSESPPRTRRA